MIPISNWEEMDDEGDDGEESMERNSDDSAGAESDENLVLSFEDPFAELVDRDWELGAY